MSKETDEPSKPSTSNKPATSKTEQDELNKKREQDALLKQAKEALIRDSRRFENNRSNGSGGTANRSRPVVNTNFLSRLIGAPQVNKKHKRDIAKKRDKKK